MQERASAVRGVEVKDDTIPGGGRATVGVACATGLPDVASSPGPRVDRGIAT
jgi:hypothetical protein